MTTPTVSAVVDAVSTAAFGKALVANNLRSMVVETMFALGLPKGWRPCGADWAGWDLEHDDGTRLEVKQSAARQTWAAPKRPSLPVFDIRERTGWYEGAAWKVGVGRHAHIYLFAYHPIVDDTADHRDAAQWEFYAAPTSLLPTTRGLSLTKLRALATTHSFAEAVAEIEALRNQRSLLSSPGAG